jgi:GNAT superfamily N-acetyltransferase
MPHVRLARTRDAETIVQFQLAMARETEGLELDRDTVTEGVRGVFRDAVRGQYLIAEIDGETVGCALVLREWSDWRNGEVLWLHSVYVEPAARRKGVLRAIYDYVRAYVDEWPQLKGIRLYVDKRNGAAREAYRALGMNAEHYDLFEWME